MSDFGSGSCAGRNLDMGETESEKVIESDWVSGVCDEGGCGCREDAYRGENMREDVSLEQENERYDAEAESGSCEVSHGVEGSGTENDEVEASESEPDGLGQEISSSSCECCGR